MFTPFFYSIMSIQDMINTIIDYYSAMVIILKHKKEVCGELNTK